MFSCSVWIGWLLVKEGHTGSVGFDEDEKHMSSSECELPV